ncbi:MAG: BatA domain-containing protein [Candidatus Altiarchaeota archaeon]|nr:BatA domain-containing protein [Candidatus Altiarchaeota archaeon]
MQLPPEILNIQTLMLANPWALIGLLLIIPVILLYLLKPKPKKIKFPTIMFITRMEKDKRFRLLPKRFIRDPLLLIQILAITVLVLAIVNPNMTTKAEKKPQGNIALVIDTSASMQANDVQPNRFQKAKEYAKQIIDESAQGTTYTIILAENTPVMALKEGNAETAQRILNQVSCADTPTNIGDSILFAKDTLSQKEDKEMYVFSDYATSEGLDIELANKIASADGINTRLIKVAEGGNNLAITEIDSKRFLTNRERFYLTATIQNYNPGDWGAKIQVQVDGENIKEINEIIPAKSTRLIYVEDSLNADPHIVSVKINTEDNLAVDNTAYVAIPRIRKYSTLLITDEGSDTYLEYALKASPDIRLTKTVLPVLPEIQEFDTIIHAEVNKELLLKGMYTELEEYVKKGGNLIILASTDLADIGEAELKQMLPVRLEWIKTMDSGITTLSEHEILKDTVLEGIIVSRYYKAEAKENTEVIVQVSGVPEIVYGVYGEGKVLYVGLNPNPTWSNFYYSSSMPIFWYQTIKWINKVETATTQQNHKTGEYLPIKENVNVTTPSNKRITAANMVLDEVGVYSIEYLGNQEKIAVNLVNERESNIAEFLDIETIDQGAGIQKEQVDVVWDMYPYLLGVTILLLLIELVYYIKRGYFKG